MNQPIDITDTIQSSGTQLDAVDITDPIEITITGVRKVSGEQPVIVNFDGDDGRPFKPCKTMRRVLVTLWGADASRWAGRRLRLYNDRTVTFGKVKTGGVRISGASHIDQAVTLTLPVSRGKYSAFRVEPMPAKGNAAPSPFDPTKILAALEAVGVTRKEAENAIEAPVSDWTADDLPALRLLHKRAAAGGEE